MRKDRQHGAIVMEATIALTAFIFAIFTILSIVNLNGLGECNLL